MSSLRFLLPWSVNLAEAHRAAQMGGGWATLSSPFRSNHVFGRPPRKDPNRFYLSDLLSPYSFHLPVFD
ncbi:hypothetical protein BHE74_00036223 [Ensete ventricosum]|nr:hypothetical protein BHE74_00036223 [Ensete ventricosum]